MAGIQHVLPKIWVPRGYAGFLVGNGSSRFGGKELSALALEELEVLANNLLKQAQELPPGAERNQALKDIGKLRQRLEALKDQHRRDRTDNQSK